MADETISTRIVANADFSALIADVHKVTASLSRLQEKLASSNKMMANQIAVMNRSFSDTLRSTGQFSTHFVSLTSDVEKFGRNLDGGKLKLNQYFNAFRDQTKTSGGLIRDLAKQQVALQNAVLQPLGRNAQGLMQFNVHVPRGLDTVKNKTALARTELQIMNKVVQDGAAQVINFGKNTQWTGRQLTVGLTVPLVAFGNAASKAFREADQELVRLMKVYGGVAGTSAIELGKVREDVVKTSREISAAMGVSFKETIGLAADIAATGKTGDELLGSIKETTRLAVLGEVDRQDAMKATLAIQSAFKQNTDELSKSINFLNAVENQTSTTLNDLVEAIPKAGPIIQGLGGSVQDLALYLTAMREGGINASEGANALKSALASLINPTDVAVGKFKTLGIDLLGIVNNNAGDLTGTLMALQGALDTLDPLKKQQAIEQLFGKFQFSRLNALFENLGRQGSQTLQVLDLMKASSEELATVASRELTAVTESASGKYRRALEGLKASLAEVGEQFLTINTVLITVIDKIVQFAMNLPGPVKQILALLGGVTAIAGPLIMLTGLLANFFGNMAKGVFHLKAFFKGGEGFKYLTPEMLAAQKAGKLVEETFYSDAKAASVLQQALRNLLDEFSLLETKAKAGAMSVNPAVSTMAGNLVMAGGRVVDPSHPLVGPMGTRSSSHMVPRSGMTESQRLQQTMFGMVPGSGPVNQKIGQNPQIYMEQDLPNVPGLTRINGVSTGIVAGEAARHHAMMATLAMQSKEEIATLKKQIVATGTVSKDLMVQFDGMLPVVSQLTTSAAQQSAAIVSQLRAGTINIEQAKARIIQLNLDIERMMVQATQAQAASMGRTINPTMIPTLNQPVVDPTGKSNMRELFKKGSTKNFINKVAGALGVRTSGAGYNIETTKPRRMATGGMVYRQDGSMGPEFKPMGTDTVPAMLTPGEFVVKADAVTPETLPYLKSLNDSGTQKDFMPANMMFQGRDANQALAGNRPGINLTGQFLANDFEALHSRGLHPMSLFYDQGVRLGYSKPELQTALRDAYQELISTFSKKGSATINSNYFEKVASSIAMKHLKKVTRVSPAMMNRRVSMAEEMLFIGHQRDGSGKGELKGSRRNRGFDGQTMPKHLVGTGSGFSGSQNAAHYSLAQELYETPPANKYTGPIGSGNTISKIFDAERGHIGPKIKPSKFNLLLSMIKNKSRFSPLAPDPRSAALTNKWRRGYANGGMVYMANGGMVPRMGTPEPAPAGYSQGGMVEYLNKGSGAPVRNSAGMGGMGFMMGGMGLQMAGQSVGGTAGSLMSSAGLAMNFIPMLGMLPKLAAGTNVVTGAFKGLTGMIGRATVAAKMFALSNPYLLAATVALAGIITLIRKMRKDSEDTKKEQISLFGVSKSGAKELGIQYVSLSDKLKAVREEQKLAADKAKAYFESYTGSGVGGLTLTLKQLKELKERVKSDMPETLKILNNIDSSKINDWAANLKAQMVSSGKSVEDATNLIYALIESSNKVGQGVGAISTKLFSQITDQSKASDYILKNLANNIKNISKIDGEAFASNLDTALTSLDSAVKSLIGTKDANGKLIDETKALAIQYERIVNSGVKNNKIGKDTLSVIQKTRPEFANILNDSDTIGGLIAKWRVHTQNVSIDLKNITSLQAEQLAGFYDAMNAASDAALITKGGVSGLESAAGVLDALTAREKAARAASTNGAAAAEKYNKAKVEGLQKELKEVKKLADAKRRALEESFDKENAELELQQAKLDLQMAVARGDNEAIASAQILIQQIQNQTSKKLTLAKINDAERKEEERINASVDAENKKREDKIASASKSGVSADNIAKTKSLVAEIAKEITDVAAKKKASEAVPDNVKFKKEYEVAASNVMQKIADNAGNKDVMEAFSDYLQKNGKTPIKDKDGKFIPLKAGTQIPFAPGTPSKADSMFSGIGANMEAFALKITGGVTFKQLYDLQAKNIVKDVNKDYGNINYNKFDPRTWANTDNMSKLIKGEGLTKGQSFTYKGSTYRVKGTSGIPEFERMAMGGYVTRAANGISGMTTSKPYLVGERGPELFVPSSGGQIIPNNILGPSYNIARGSSNSVQGGMNSSSSNVVYNIDIDLNGTNVTADDIMRKFKSELALIGAKEGRVRTLGGNY